VALRKEKGGQEYEQILRSNLKRSTGCQRSGKPPPALKNGHGCGSPASRPRSSDRDPHDVVGQVGILAQAKQIHLQTVNSMGNHRSGGCTAPSQLLLNLIENASSTPRRKFGSVSLKKEGNAVRAAGNTRGSSKSSSLTRGLE